MARARPIIGIPADRRMVGKHPFHMVGEKYARAVLEAAGAAPVLVPALAEELGFDELLERLDGLLFTGSPSNVEPHHYDGPPSSPARCTTRRAMPRRCRSSGRQSRRVCRCSASAAASRR